MKDLTVEAKIPEFHDTLLKQRLITKPTKLRVKMYWQKPNKRDSKVLGLTGYTNLEMGLKQSFDRKFDLFVPGQIKRLTKGYQLKNFNVKDGIEYIEATDPTGKKIVQRYLFGFDKKGLLKKMKVYRPTGIENRIFTYERRKDASNRYVLKTLEVTVLGAGFRTITTHQVAYEKTSGFVLPSKLETSTRLVHTAKKSKSREKWREMVRQIEDDFSFLGESYHCKIAGWKFRFDSHLNIHQRRDIVFTKVKQLKLAEQNLIRRLEESQKELHQSGGNIVERRPNLIEPVWGERQLESAPVNHEEGYLIFELPDHVNIALGKTAQGNDFIRSQWAKKDYVWFHLEGGTSCHLIVNKKIDEIGQDIFNLAGNLIAKYSKYGAEIIPLIFTQVSNLKGVKGSAGMVRYKKEKRMCVNIDEEVFNQFGVKL
jgi:hypothetical protein